MFDGLRSFLGILGGSARLSRLVSALGAFGPIMLEGRERERKPSSKRDEKLGRCSTIFPIAVGFQPTPAQR